tara:strand:+ start:87 stop:335 length:249 start_codon:yes stop_codon:yes gene_type:complete
LDKKDIQLSFLRTFTDRNDIIEVKLYSISVPPLKPLRKDGRKRAQRHMDFTCTESGDIFVAEVQAHREEHWNKRALYSAAGV